MKISIEENGVTYMIDYSARDVSPRNTVSELVVKIDRLLRLLYPDVMTGRQIRFSSAHETAAQSLNAERVPTQPEWGAEAWRPTAFAPPYVRENAGVDVACAEDTFCSSSNLTSSSF